MSNEVVKVQIANRLLDEYGKDIQSQCMGGCVSRCDANKTIFAIRQSARRVREVRELGLHQRGIQRVRSRDGSPAVGG